MADSKQLDILKRLTLHLKGITPANGYNFDLSDKVFRGRRRYGDADPTPIVSIVEHLTGDIAVQTAGFERIIREENWVLLVQGWLKYSDAVDPTDEAYQLKASLEKRLSDCVLINSKTGDPAIPSSYYLGTTGIITGMTIGPGVVSVGTRDDSSSYAFVYLPLGINMAVDVSDPFLP